VLVAAPGGSLDPEAVLAYLGVRLAHFKIPQYVRGPRGSAARNPGGKILKRQSASKPSGRPPAGRYVQLRARECVGSPQ